MSTPITIPEFNTLNVDFDGSRGLLTVELNRPEVRNAFNDLVIDELTTVFSETAVSPEVRAIVLRGAGKVFCAGGDLNWMKGAVNWSLEKNLADTRHLARLFGMMNEFPKPLIGVVHGAAIGGGVGLVSVCDMVLAEKETVFSLSEVRLGIVPACIGPFVVAKIGPSHARGMFVSAERFKSGKAYEMGLVHRVCEGAEELDVALEQTLNNILQCGPQAMALAKDLVLSLSWPEKRASLGDPLEFVAKMLAEVRTSDEGQEGVRAFLEKRKPSWTEGAQ